MNNLQNHHFRIRLITAAIVCVLFLAGSPALAADSFDRESPVTVGRFSLSLFAGASDLGLTEDLVQRLHALADTYLFSLNRAVQDIGLAHARDSHSPSDAGGPAARPSEGWQAATTWT